MNPSPSRELPVPKRVTCQGCGLRREPVGELLGPYLWTFLCRECGTDGYARRSDCYRVWTFNRPAEGRPDNAVTRRMLARSVRRLAAHTPSAVPVSTQEGARP